MSKYVKFEEDLKKYHLPSTPPSDGVKIVDLYQKIENGFLDLSPDFQRKLVWKEKHKLNFIKTILMNFPFPEIYIASKDIDLDLNQAREVVVDGKQRLTTICDYINGNDTFDKVNGFVPLFSELDVNTKKSFLNYKVTVRDLKDVDSRFVDEIFRRINSTEYPLNRVELFHSSFGDSEFMLFVKQLTESKADLNFDSIDYVINSDFCAILQKKLYEEWAIFPARDQDRMFVLMFFMNLIVTLLEDRQYFSRNAKFEGYLEKYNDHFEEAFIIDSLIQKSFNTFLKLDRQKGSFILSKSMLFTMLIELSNHSEEDINFTKFNLLLNELEEKYKAFSNHSPDLPANEMSFFEACRNSVNEKKNRELRAKVVNDLILQCIKSKIGES